MARFLAKKRLGSLHPVDEQGESMLRKISPEDLLAVEVKRPRNGKFHRKFFAMLQIILENQSHYKSIDDLLDVCKLRVGHCRTIETRQGEVKVPASISFASMDQSEFEAFYDRACAWVVEEVIPGLQRSDLDAEVEAQLMEFGGIE